MKFAHLLFVAALCTASAAAAQTTPVTPGTTVSAPGAPGTTTASPSTVPSGTAPINADPKGAVSAGEVFTTGAPTNSTRTSEKRAMRRQNKTMKANGKTKVKTTM